MPARARNNPRQIRIKSCGCPQCTERFRPGEKPTRRHCTGPWQARYRDPEGRQRARNFPTKREAEAFLDSTRTKVRTGTYIDTDRGQIKLADWYTKWSATRRIGPTAQVHAEILWGRHIEPYFGSWPLSAISHIDVEEWIGKLTTVTGRNTIGKTIQMMRGMMAAAVRDRRILHNPCDGVKRPPARQAHPDDLIPPTYEQLAAIRAHMPAHYHPFLIVAEETGLRWGELIGLRRCWVDLEAAQLQVRETIIYVRGTAQRKAYPKSQAGFRTVPLSQRAVTALRAHLEAHPARGTRSSPVEGLEPEELVFRTQRAGLKRGRAGQPFQGVMVHANFWKLWTAAAQSAGVARQVHDEVTGRLRWWPHFHDVRHAFASRLHRLGVPEADAQRILGHERGARITWLYTHASADAITRIRSVLDDDGTG